MYNISQVGSIYDSLTQKVKEDLDEQFEKGRLKGTDYANVYAQLMDRCLQLAFQSPLNEAQVRKINSDRAINEAQSSKDLLLKNAEIALKNAQASKVNSDRNIAEDQSQKDLEIKQEQKLLYQRQRQGFNDNVRLKLLEAQLNAWSMMFSSGMLTREPSIISQDKASTIYDDIVNSL